MKLKLTLLLIISLLTLNFPVPTNALTLQEILQGRDNPSLTSSGSSAGQVLGASTTGLVGYWKFDEGSGTVATDSSGSGNNGTLTGGPTRITGKVGSGALSFGSNQSVSLNSLSGFPSGSGASWTMSAWVKTNVVDSAHHIIAMYGNQSNGQTPHIALSAANKWRASTWGNDLDANSPSPTVGVWTHITGVANGSSLSIYVNGALAGGPTTITNSPSVTGGYIGNSGGNNFFNGAIDEVRVYNRALSAQEVLDVYNDAGASPTPTPTVTPTPTPTSTPTPTPTITPTPTPTQTGNTITAASCNQTDVQNAINAVSNGGTVIIPNGTCTWESGITTSKQIKIQGQTKGSVKLIMGAGINSYDTALIHFTTGTSYSTEISNLQFWPGAGIGMYLLVDGAETDKPPLIYNNQFSSGSTDNLFSFITYRRYGGGVIHHNTFQSTYNLSNQFFGRGGIQVKDINDTTSWSSPSTMGTADTTGLNNLYIEDNTFTNVATFDSDDASRIVFRHNILNDSPMASHGADTSWTGFRHIEIYDNQIYFHPSGTWTLYDINGSVVTGQYPLNINRWYDTRGGTGVITGNLFPDIISQSWGDKAELALQIQQADRNAGPNPCATTYPVYHQVGRGMNNTSEPLYIWGNTGTGKVETPSIENSGYNECPSNPNQNNPGYYIQLNRDFYTGIAKPGWARYTYPHPLASGITPPPADTTAPSVPTGLTAVAVSSSAINLSWTASTDNVAVTGYDIYRNGLILTTVNSPLTTFSNTGLSASTNYSYTVRAKDAAGNVSAQSTSVSATTQTQSGTTITAASCSQTDVQAAINSATDGMTIIIPAGTCAWTQTVNVDLSVNPRSLTIQGSLTGSTVIVDNVPKDQYVYPALITPQVMDITVNTGKSFRLTNLTFEGGTGMADPNNKGMVIVRGSSKALRIDHNTFHATRTSVFHVYANYAVFDHNTFNLDGWHFAFYIFNGLSWNGIGWGGDNSWADDLHLGTDQAVFIEDSIFNSGIAGQVTFGIDGWSGARVVFRHNSLHNVAIGNHGTESPGFLRGARSFEVYNNTFTVDSGLSNDELMAWRSGDGIIFSNQITGGVSSHSPIRFSVYRDFAPFAPFGQCDGLGPYDLNDGVTYKSGTYNGVASAGTGSWDQINTFPGENWTTNQWVGYSIRNTTIGSSAIISANTSNTLTVHRDGSWGGPLLSWNPGDQFIILKATACIDQTGRGKGILYSRDSNGNPTPVAWSQQVPESTYVWNNTLNGANIIPNVDSPHIVVGRDVINSAMPGYTAYTYPHPLASGTPPPPTDTTAPSVPTGLAATAITVSQINLSWTASTDNVGVTGYRIYRNGSLLTTVNSPLTTYSDTGLIGSTSYTYTVSAYDAAGNTSSQSTSATTSTQSGQPVPGDLNSDHIVNALDYSLLNSKWLQSFSAYDLQADGLINSLDFAILASDWGKTW